MKETLEAEYRLKKQEELMSLLLDQALRSEGVKILYQPPAEPQAQKESSRPLNSRNFFTDRRDILVPHR